MARVRADRDYYRLLGVSPEAPPEEIRRAYRRLALESHPDRNPGDRTAEDRFKAISEAYAVLVDPGRRRAYDAARRQGRPADFTGSREDLFRDLFADREASAVFEELAREMERLGLRVDRSAFHQTLFGGRGTVRGAVFVVTPMGAARAFARLAGLALRGAPRPPAPPPAAPRPRPSWPLRLARWLLGPGPAAAPSARDRLVPLRLSAAEAARGGARRVALGQGEEVLVRIPPGVRSGTRLRLRGKGLPSAAGPRGDAYLVVEVS